MREVRILVSIITAIVLLTGCEKENVNVDSPVQVSGIQFSPNCFIKDGEIVGTDIDIATMAMDETGIDMEINMAESWDIAYNETLNGTNRALLTCGYSNERKDLFKWAGPTSQGVYSIFAKSKTGIGQAIGIDASKDVQSIAAVNGWLETTTLEDLGFQNLIYYDSYDDALTAFMNDEVKSIASDGYHLIESLPEGYYLQEGIKTVSRYRTVFYYIAFSKDVEDAVVEKCQSAIETMITNKKTLSIIQRYCPYATEQLIPGTIQLFTEVAPPFNYFTQTVESAPDIKIEGSSTEIINEIQLRNGYSDAINISSWTDAYTTVQYLPNSAVFTTARTPEREHLFQWAGPISTLRACFYTRAGSGIQIETPEQAKALNSIATPRDWYTQDYLVKNGFQNIVATSFSPVEAFNQLINGEVDALLMFDLGVKWLCEKTGTPATDISEQMQTSVDKGYIAFSLNTPPNIVRQWQDNLDAMKEDGAFATIWNKWYEGTEMP
jgi:polar amino acid transport system substrate-binding protein